MLNILNKQDTVLNNFLKELRDENIQKDPMRFRENLRRIGFLMAYEISKTLTYKQTDVPTPLGVAQIELPQNKIVIATILRAGIPFHQGFLDVFDGAESAFISSHRHWSKKGELKIVVESVATASLEGKTLILVDPMFATGGSIQDAYNTLIEKAGRPDKTHIASVIATDEGVEYVKKNMALENVTIWTAALDHDMTVKNYIIPGIGDPGDLAFGEKI